LKNQSGNNAQEAAVKSGNFVKFMHVCVALCAIASVGFTSIAYGGIITIDDPGANSIYKINVNPDGSVGSFTASSPPTSGIPYSYGVPSASGNTLTFNQLGGLNFSSLASGSNTSHVVDGSLSLDILARPNTNITSVSLTEQGAYSFGLNSDSGTAARVRFLSGLLTINDTYTLPVDMTFTTPSPNEVNSKTITYSIGNDFGTWYGDTFNIDLSNFGPITKVNLLFDNNLETSRGGGSYSLIDKKNIVLTTTTITVPEPGAILMFSLGIFGLGIWLRKQ
jgi:hypothetical protein